MVRNVGILKAQMKQMQETLDALLQLQHDKSMKRNETDAGNRQKLFFKISTPAQLTELEANLSDPGYKELVVREYFIILFEMQQIQC